MMGLIRNILIIVFCCLRTLTLMSQEKNLVYKTGVNINFNHFQAVPYTPFIASFKPVNTSGYGLSLEVEPSLYVKQWFMKINLGFNYSRQKQIAEVKSVSTEQFEYEFLHKINALYSGISLGRSFNINSFHAIEFQLGFKAQLPITKNESVNGSFTAIPIQSGAGSSIEGTYENKYILDTFYSPFLRLGYKFKIDKHELGAFIDFTLFAMDYTVNHELQLENRYSLSSSWFYANSIGFGLGYTF